MKRPRSLLLFLLLVLLAGCGGPGDIVGPKVTVTIYYGSEKQDWLEPLVEQYNNARHKTASGATVVVEVTPMGSIESLRAILSGEIQPTVWSPASSIYIPTANAEWRKTHADDLVVGAPEKLVLSPVVIAMWKPMAEALGWSDEPLGWADIAALASSDEGWSAYGYPEWGSFKFGHTHPNFSNSGFISVLAEAYAGTGKIRDLTLADLPDPELVAFMAAVESGVIHYGSSTGFFAERMFTRGPSYLSAAVLYENLVVAQESKRLAGQSNQGPVVAIYPKEGTFWSDHPYVVLNAPWVTTEQREAAEDFQAFLLDRPQQLKAIELGFRPSDVSIPLAAPLDADHGVDPAQPQTVLEAPTADVLAAVLDLWQQVKKPVDLIVLIDVSGSMAGEKIAAARASLLEFVEQLDDRDRLEVLVFSDDVLILTPLTELGPKRRDVLRRISGIIEGGSTRLYDATLTALDALQQNGDPQHIRAVVVLSDGMDTQSTTTLDDVLAGVGQVSEEGGTSIKLFTIAFGNDADKNVLRQMAETTGGKLYSGDPKTIRQIYAEIATFF